MLALYLSMLESDEDKSKFHAVYYKYRMLMANRAYDILGDRGLTEDAVQNAFLNILKNLTCIGDVDSPRTKNFVVIVTENCAKDIYRKEHRVFVEEFNGNEATDYLEAETEDRFAVESIKKQINALPDIYSHVLTLKYFNDFADKDIASALSVSVSTVRKRLIRGKNLLQNSLRRVS